MFLERNEVEKFWDTVHADNRVMYLSNTGAGGIIPHYEKVGPFAAEYQTGPYLEIGPGNGDLLYGATRPRYAVEVSAVNRDRVAPSVDGVWSPYDDPQPLGCRLATAFLVFQHCDDAMHDRLLAWVAAALAPGGSFYCQTAEWVDGRKMHADNIIKGGNGRPITEFEAAAVKAGLVADKHARYEHTHDGASVWWISRFKRA